MQQTDTCKLLLGRFVRIRAVSKSLCATLEIEDYCVQTMQNVSPPKWHLAHTTWFFEQFILLPYLTAYQAYHPGFAYLFNSYYETLGSFFPRHARGSLSRPTVVEIYNYRQHVESALQELVSNPPEQYVLEICQRLALGIEHEIQHQELLLMDIKYNFFVNPLKPTYAKQTSLSEISFLMEMGWQEYAVEIVETGHQGDSFCFDNERPKHKSFLQDFKLANRLVTNTEYLAFIDDAGYERAALWLADGWQTINTQAWHAPLYWFKEQGDWWQFTLSGIQSLDPNQPVAHISYYEADAYARWLGKRLPTEQEWESVAVSLPIEGNFLESGVLHPQAAQYSGMTQLFGDLWEWTQSPYTAYPGFKPLPDSLGEYNAKFMSNQMVLRGGCCATALEHIRPSYRNFYHPDDRWLFSGLRLAEDA
ncbi:ergothioneine biosynthesis protein EgtB [Methylomonas sp. AM2-LC]|uniref:ergothioneine biosynthesis protein EgtB n=1 Tax=Methylomonas sp. AM2-LC TaxID=3153301 RepID=UPI0032632CD0